MGLSEFLCLSLYGDVWLCVLLTCRLPVCEEPSNTSSLGLTSFLSARSIFAGQPC